MKNTETTRTHTHVVAGKFASETSVRNAIRRRRQGNPSTTPIGSVTPQSSGEQAAPSTGESPVLRRWSVAELIARAVPVPRAEQVGPC